MSIVMDTGSEWVKGVVHLLTLMWSKSLLCNTKEDILKNVFVFYNKSQWGLMLFEFQSSLKYLLLKKRESHMFRTAWR